jgi:glycosyltransferase involved in cell wall biosynthesis
MARGAVAEPRVSVVVPLYNEAPTLRPLKEAVTAVLEREGWSFELLFVDDGSTDDSAAMLADLVADDARVHAYRLPRNFGKAAALAVGFRAARGERIVTMDADLQDDPDEVPVLLAKLDGQFDLVTGWKRERHDPATRRLASHVFNAATSAVSGVHLHDFNCGLKAYTRPCAKAVAQSCYGDMHRYLPVLAHWEGFDVTEVVVRHHERRFGRSRYGLERYLRGLLDLMTTVFLCRYARRPMHVFGAAGLLLLFVGVLVLFVLGIEKIAFGHSLSNRPLLILGALMVIAGLQLALTGLIAEMLTRQRAAEEQHLVAGIVPGVPVRGPGDAG